MVDFILADPLLKDLPRSEVEHALGVVGFTDAMKQGSITSLSGGAWWWVAVAVVVMVVVVVVMRTSCAHKRC